MNDQDIKRAERIRKSVDTLGIPSVEKEDIEWVIEKFFELLKSKGGTFDDIEARTICNAEVGDGDPGFIGLADDEGTE